jgi:hypothetical protein
MAKLTNWLKKNGKQHLVDSTAINIELTPLYAAFETGIGMSHEESRNARLLGAGIAYAGMGFLYGKGRNLWRKTFGITDKTSERTQAKHDAMYTGTFSLFIAPAIYVLSGGTDAKEIVLGGFCAAGVGLVNGIPLGYTTDLFRDLTGLRNSERVPELVRKQNSKVKKGLASLLVGASIGLTSAIYHFTPDKNQSNPDSVQQISERQDNSYLEERFTDSGDL